MKKFPFYTLLWAITGVNLVLCVLSIKHLDENTLVGITVLAVMTLALHLIPIMFPDKHPDGFSMTAALIFVVATIYGTGGIVLVSLFSSLGLLILRRRLWRAALFNPGSQSISAVIGVLVAHALVSGHSGPMLLFLYVLIYWLVFVPMHLVTLSMLQMFWAGGRWGRIYSDITPVHFWTLYFVEILAGLLMLTVMKFEGIVGVVITFLILLVFTQVYSKYIAVSVQSRTDDLTSLFNRRYLMKHLGRCWENCRELSLILLDVDSFKKYNDSLGHPKGDLLLQEIGSVIQACVGELGISARYGGEEFAVLLPNAGSDSALECAENIRRTISEYEFFGMQYMPSGRITVSVGVATKTLANEQKDLLENADRALYSVKENGKNDVQLFRGQPVQAQLS